MKKVLSDLPILSAARFVAGVPKDLVIILLEGDVTAAENAVNLLSAPTNFN